MQVAVEGIAPVEFCLITVAELNLLVSYDRKWNEHVSLRIIFLTMLNPTFIFMLLGIHAWFWCVLSRESPCWVARDFLMYTQHETWVPVNDFLRCFY